MSYASESARSGNKPVRFVDLLLDECSRVYGTGLCDAGLVASDTAQTGAASSITLAAADIAATGYYIGMRIKITDGTGSGNTAIVLSYDSTTKIAVISGTWTAPDATSEYSIFDVISANACRNTRGTCQDIPNYNNSAGTQVVRLAEPRQGLPLDDRIFDCVNSIDETFGELRPDKGIALRSSVRIVVEDFKHHDRTMDPYIDQRTHDTSLGTFFGKLLSRNPHYTERHLLIKSGFITDPFDWSNFQERLYLIENIEGPNISSTEDGETITYTITAADMTMKADSKKVQIPAPSDGKLDAALTAGHLTSFTLDIDATTADYPAGGGTVTIGKEILSYGSRSGLVCSTLSRGLHGTSDIAHSLGDTVQVAKVINANVVNLIHDILSNHMGIDPDLYIPFDEGLTVPLGTPLSWDDEKSNWLSGVTINTVIPKPIGGLKLLNELLEENQIDLWADPTAKTIELKANTPPLGNAAVTTIGEDLNIVEGTLSIESKPEMRASRVFTEYDLLNVLEGPKDDNFAISKGQIDGDQESEAAHRGSQSVFIKSRLFTSANNAIVTQSQQRHIQRFNKTPKIVSFTLHMKDSALGVADLADMDTRHLQDPDGSNCQYRVQIISKKEIEHGHKFQYKSLSFAFNSRNAFIGPITLASYTLESDSNKDAYGFIAPNDANFADGGAPYSII